MNNDFNEFFKSVVNTISSGLEGILSFIERKMFMSLVNCLKYNDIEAVRNALDQLVEENNKLAIAPIYAAYKKHPSMKVRKLCGEALSKIDDMDKIRKITNDNHDKESIEALIKEYGNYRYDK